MPSIQRRKFPRPLVQRREAEQPTPDSQPQGQEPPPTTPRPHRVPSTPSTPTADAIVVNDLLARLGEAARINTRERPYHQAFAQVEQQQLFASLDLNLQLVQGLMNNCGDVGYRSFVLDLPGAPRAALVYADGLVDKNIIDQTILLPLMQKQSDTAAQRPGSPEPMGADLADLVRSRLLPHSELQEARILRDVEEGVLRGKTALLLDGFSAAFLASTQGWETRMVEEPTTEGLVRGPRDGFTENLRTNTALLRLRLPTGALKFEQQKIGRMTRTEVAIAYVEGVVNPSLVQEVHRRLARIEIDGVLESGYLEEFIEDSPWSPFPQIEHTERPDKTAGALLEGRLAIMTANTPFVLLIPTTLPQFLSSTEDYYERFWYSTTMRWIRLFGVFVALLLPSLYVGITTYQVELVPTNLLFSLAAGREGVPFPSVVEAVLMEVSLEVLREAGIRMPRPVGQAVSIVGGLVIGESAVRAGIASPAMVIVVALTAIASFAVPGYNAMNAIRILRFGMMILAATMGLPGVMWGVVGLHVHLVTLRSFGMPYLAPLSPLKVSNLQDLLIRAPWWAMVRRPWFSTGREQHRQPRGQAPHPPQPTQSGGKGGA